MHLLDIIIVLLALIFSLIGYFSGLIGQLSTPLALVAGVVCAWYGHPFIAQQMASWFSIPIAVTLCAIFFCFIAGALIIKLLSALARSLLENDEGNRRADRICGALLGFLKGTILAASMVFLIATFGKRELMSNAILATPLFELSSWTLGKVDSTSLLNSARDWGDSTIRDNLSTENIYDLLKYINETPTEKTDQP